MSYYLFVMADNIRSLFEFGVFVTVCLLIILGAICLRYFIEGLCYEDEFKRSKKAIIFIIPFFVISLLGDVFIPSTKQLAAIYLLPKIVENKKISQIPDKAFNLVDEWIKELSPKNRLEEK